jgi:hypothetical protein
MTDMKYQKGEGTRAMKVRFNLFHFLDCDL